MVQLWDKARALLEKLYPQFQPKRALDVRAVVLANKNTPDSAITMGVCASVEPYGQRGPSLTGKQEECPFPPNAWKLDCPTAEWRSGKCNQAEDSIVSVRDVNRAVSIGCSSGR